MVAKHKINTSLKMTYILYIIYLVYITKTMMGLGVLNKFTSILDIVDNIEVGFGMYTYLFQLAFLLLLAYSVKDTLKEVEICEDEDKARKITKKLIPYKIFIALNILVGVALSIEYKALSLILQSTLLISASILIHYAKESYTKAYLYDRKLLWIESVNGEKYDESDIDSKFWRYKIWYDKKEKVQLKSRLKRASINLLNILLYGSLYTLNGFILFTILFGYVLLKNILGLIENIFNLYTSTNGICTGVIDKSTSKHREYDIIVTDYDNKREVHVKTRENYNIKEMDYLEVVHGIFTKESVAINSIKINEKNSGHVIAILIPVLIFGLPAISNILSKIKVPIVEDNYYNENMDYEEQQKLENTNELISKDDGDFFKVIKLNKEEAFNDVTITLYDLYLGKNTSKICFDIINNTDLGMVINVDYNTHIRENGVKNSNILLPGKTYNIEMDILQDYKKFKHRQLLINLEYTLSETILNEYLDFNDYMHYPLNVIDNDCMMYINLKNESVEMNFNEYEQFYTKNDERYKFME